MLQSFHTVPCVYNVLFIKGESLQNMYSIISIIIRLDVFFGKVIFVRNLRIAFFATYLLKNEVASDW